MSRHAFFNNCHSPAHDSRQACLESLLQLGIHGADERSGCLKQPLGLLLYTGVVLVGGGRRSQAAQGQQVFLCWDELV